MSTKLKNPKEIKKAFDDLFASITPEEKAEQDARLLAFAFLSEIEKARDKKGISKKELAEKVGTSASYITQLFQGDKSPNFTILAKMQEALNIRFEIKTTDEQGKFGCNDLAPAFEKGGFWVYHNTIPDYEKPKQLPEQDYFSQVG